MADLVEYLKDSLSDLRLPYEARRLAEILYQQAAAGLVPSMQKVRLLRRLIETPRSCARLTPDGTCAWLRRNARQEGLRMPGPGEKLYCHRRASGTIKASYEGCGGYRKVRDDNANLDA